MYYDINRVLVSERHNGQKWLSGVNCELPIKEEYLIVFDIPKKEWKYQLLSTWNSYLISIGNLKLSPTQKLDDNDKIVNKTHDELYSEGLITKDEYIKIKTNEINSNFDINSTKVGVVFIGSYITYDTKEQINNPSFQYDKDSQFMLLQAKDDSRVLFWRSVNNKNISLTNTEMNELYELIKVTYYTKFAEKSQEIDAL